MSMRRNIALITGASEMGLSGDRKRWLYVQSSATAIPDIMTEMLKAGGFSNPAGSNVQPLSVPCR
jgi:hypothetical protein